MLAKTVVELLPMPHNFYAYSSLNAQQLFTAVMPLYDDDEVQEEHATYTRRIRSDSERS